MRYYVLIVFKTGVPLVIGPYTSAQDRDRQAGIECFRRDVKVFRLNQNGKHTIRAHAYSVTE